MSNIQTVRQRIFALWDRIQALVASLKEQERTDWADLVRWTAEIERLSMLFISKEHASRGPCASLIRTDRSTADILSFELLVPGALLAVHIHRAEGVEVGPANAPAAEPILRHVVAVLEREVER